MTWFATSPKRMLILIYLDRSEVRLGMLLGYTSVGPQLRGTLLRGLVNLDNVLWEELCQKLQLFILEF